MGLSYRVREITPGHVVLDRVASCYPGKASPIIRVQLVAKPLLCIVEPALRGTLVAVHHNYHVSIKTAERDELFQLLRILGAQAVQ
ncbi:hypothetical protein D3C85_1810860 [compost metagenome]